MLVRMSCRATNSPASPHQFSTIPTYYYIYTYSYYISTESACALLFDNSAPSNLNSSLGTVPAPKIDILRST